ncbi:hypothetical protein J6O86_02850, partial [bacterium]|nr:hypothetical protein [bacterium]
MPVGKNLLAGLKQRPTLIPQPYGIQAHATHKFVGSLCIPLGEGAVVGEFMSHTTAGEGENRK